MTQVVLVASVPNPLSDVIRTQVNTELYAQLALAGYTGQEPDSTFVITQDKGGENWDLITWTYTSAS